MGGRYLLEISSIFYSTLSYFQSLWFSIWSTRTSDDFSSSYNIIKFDFLFSAKTFSAQRFHNSRFFLLCFSNNFKSASGKLTMPSRRWIDCDWKKFATHESVHERSAQVAFRKEKNRKILIGVRVRVVGAAVSVRRISAVSLSAGSWRILPRGLKVGWSLDDRKYANQHKDSPGSPIKRFSSPTQSHGQLQNEHTDVERLLWKISNTKHLGRKLSTWGFIELEGYFISYFKSHFQESCHRTTTGCSHMCYWLRFFASDSVVS